MTSEEVKGFAKRGIEVELGMVDVGLEQRFQFNDMSPTDSLRHLLAERDRLTALLQQIDTLTIVTVDKA